MREGFENIQVWVGKVERARPATDQLVALLQNYGASVEADLDSRDVSRLSYIARFFFGKGVFTTIWFVFMDWQTDSDVVITDMITLPEEGRSLGFGSKAITVFLAWARDNNLKKVCATQVHGAGPEKFWVEYAGFTRNKEPNDTSDFIFQCQNVRED